MKKMNRIEAQTKLFNRILLLELKLKKGVRLNIMRCSNLEMDVAVFERMKFAGRFVWCITQKYRRFKPSEIRTEPDIDILEEKVWRFIADKYKREDILK